jgi:Mg-chelatase subunit ChlD
MRSMEPNDERTTTETTADGTPPVHLYVLLDRSGSMESIRAEVIGGFNAFVASQQVNGADARLTLVQFDTVDLADTIVDDLAIRQVRGLRRHDFQPRGGTPLLDATAQLIARATTRTDARAAAGTPEQPVVVTITDGLENASREFTRAALRDLVTAREAAGWTFVYLSAGLDAYDEAASFGYAAGSTQAWSPDPEGAGLAFASLSVAVGDLRGRVRAAAPVDAHEAFATGGKAAETDRRRKRGDHR